MTRIAATARIPSVGHGAFSAIGDIEELEWPVSKLDAEVLLVRSEPMTSADIERAGNLQVIARTGSGVDNVDVEAATRRGVPVLFAPTAGARPVAEGAIALMLAAAKRVGEHGAVLREDRWPDRYGVVGVDLRGAILGLVGYGSIGREVGRLARALGMDVLAFDPKTSPNDDEGSVRMVELAELLRSADIVSLHCPLTATTKGLVDQHFLSSMKAGAVFVNTARGEIVASDELLISALRDGHLSSVALDVFEREPPDSTSQLLKDPRVIASPHTIGLTNDWNQLVFAALADDVARCLRGEEPVHVVNPSALTRPAATE